MINRDKDKIWRTGNQVPDGRAGAASIMLKSIEYLGLRNGYSPMVSRSSNGQLIAQI